MPYIVPQFIEKEPKIVGPLTLKQFVFIGTAGGLVIFLYFVLNFLLFIISAIILGGASLALAFLKIKGFPLPVVIKNFFIFLTKEKIYLWKKKDFFPQPIRKKELKKETTEKDSLLGLQERSQLKRLATFIETRTR